MSANGQLAGAGGGAHDVDAGSGDRHFPQTLGEQGAPGGVDLNGAVGTHFAVCDDCNGAVGANLVDARFLAAHSITEVIGDECVEELAAVHIKIA